mgnify:FL=1
MTSTILALTGLATILLVLAAILSKRLSPLVAFTVLPLGAAVVLGRGGDAGALMQQGMLAVAPMGAMFLFAILFFAVLADAKLFEPIIAAVLRFGGDHPGRVAVGTAILTTIVQLDGSGAVTFLIVVPALAPVYDRLGMDRRVLACVVAMGAGVGNMLPWGGPTIRAATALDVSVTELFNPVIPVFLAGTAATLLFSWWLGVRQRNTLVVLAGASGPSPGGELATALPNWQFWANIALVIAVLGTMLAEFAPPAVAFLVGTVLALLINFPRVSDQWDAVTRHGGAAITMVAILFAAGAFTGIMRGTGMLDALARGGADLLPGGSASQLPVIVAVQSMPLSLLFDPDSFYFGILPLLGGIAEHGGVPAIEVGRAAILGQMTTGFPVSPMTPATFLLVGLAKIDLADHQRFAIPYLFALTLVMTLVALALGVIRL